MSNAQSGTRSRSGSKAGTGTPALDARTRAWCLAAAAACVLPLLLQVPATLALVIMAVALVGAALSWRRPLPVVVRMLLATSLVMLVLAVEFDGRFGKIRDKAWLPAAAIAFGKIV